MCGFDYRLWLLESKGHNFYLFILSLKCVGYTDKHGTRGGLVASQFSTSYCFEWRIPNKTLLLGSNSGPERFPAWVVNPVISVGRYYEGKKENFTLSIWKTCKGLAGVSELNAGILTSNSKFASLFFLSLKKHRMGILNTGSNSLQLWEWTVYTETSSNIKIKK